MILSLGWFACAAAIVKAVKQWNILSEPDWTVGDSFNVWNFVEFTIGIIAASLPALKPFFNWFFETARAFTSAGRTKMGDYKGGSGLRGYQNTTEQWGKNIQMDSLPGNTAVYSQTSSNKGYDVQVTGVADREGWEAHRKSDESIEPLRQPRHTLAPHGIVVSREISVV